MSIAAMVADAVRDALKRDKQTDRIAALEARLALVTAALEFYAVREAYLHDDGECPAICTDEGDKAREALNSTKAG